MILLKSRFDKLLSPITLIGIGVSTKSPRINLPSVPEFFAFIIMLRLEQIIYFKNINIIELQL